MKKIIRIATIAVVVAIAAIGISIGAAATDNCWGNATCE